MTSLVLALSSVDQAFLADMLEQLSATGHFSSQDIGGILVQRDQPANRCLSSG